MKLLAAAPIVSALLVAAPAPAPAPDKEPPMVFSAWEWAFAQPWYEKATALEKRPESTSSRRQRLLDAWDANVLPKIEKELDALGRQGWLATCANPWPQGASAAIILYRDRRDRWDYRFETVDLGKAADESFLRGVRSPHEVITETLDLARQWQRGGWRYVGPMDEHRRLWVRKTN